MKQTTSKKENKNRSTLIKKRTVVQKVKKLNKKIKNPPHKGFLHWMKENHVIAPILFSAIFGIIGFLLALPVSDKVEWIKETGTFGMSNFDPLTAHEFNNRFTENTNYSYEYSDKSQKSDYLTITIQNTHTDRLFLASSKIIFPYGFNVSCTLEKIGAPGESCEQYTYRPQELRKLKFNVSIGNFNLTNLNISEKKFIFKLYTREINKRPDFSHMFLNDNTVPITVTIYPQ